MRTRSHTWDAVNDRWIIEEHAGPPTPRLITCAMCREPKRVANLGNYRRYCNTCQPIAWVERGKAQFKVAAAIRRGTLAHPSKFDCVDCGAKACVYDHRRYSAPLDVVPVCKRCNNRRGPAEWGTSPPTPFFLEPAPL